MEQYLIGKTIKEFRLRNHLSQEKLAGTLCAVSTLSRIENGDQIPNWKLVEALFSKMGMTAPLHTVPMSETDLERWNLEYEITNSVANRNYETEKMLEKYRTCGPEPDILEKQFYIFFSAIYNTTHGIPPQKTLPRYIEAFKLTIKSFSLNADISSISVHLLTKIERMILNNIALTLYALNKREKAISLLTFLKTYFESHTIDENEKAKDYPVILYNLSNWEGLAGNYEEALKLAESGITECIRYGQLTYFPYLIFNKGYILLGMENRTEGKKIIEHAFIIMEELSKHTEVVALSKKINEIFGLDFIEK